MSNGKTDYNAEYVAMKMLMRPRMFAKSIEFKEEDFLDRAIQAAEIEITVKQLKKFFRVSGMKNNTYAEVEVCTEDGNTWLLSNVSFRAFSAPWFLDSTTSEESHVSAVHACVGKIAYIARRYDESMLNPEMWPT